MMCVCGNHFVTVPLRHYKRSSWRHKHSSRRSVNKAALNFGNLCMNLVLFRSVPLFRNKSYDSWKKPSQFVAQLHHLCMFSICSKYWRLFLDAYSMYDSVNKSCRELLATLFYGGSLGPCKSAYFKSAYFNCAQFNSLYTSTPPTSTSLVWAQDYPFTIILVLICQMFC